MARPGLTSHRKFRRLAAALGSNLIAMGALELLWQACYESVSDYLGTSDEIEHMVGWAGEKGALTLALLDAGEPDGVGFIEPVERRARTRDSYVLETAAHEHARTEPRYRVHDLWENAPEYVLKRREREAKRKERVTGRKRVRRTAAVRRPSGAESSEKGAGWTPSVQSSTEQSSTEQDKKNICAATSAAPPPEPPVLVFPTQGNPDSWGLRQSQVDEWQAAYPGLDIADQCRRALAWIRANRMMTARGMPRFLVRWFNNSVDRPASKSPPRQGPRPVPVHEPWVCPHVDQCPSQAACRIKLNLPAKYPIREVS